MFSSVCDVMKTCCNGAFWYQTGYNCLCCHQDVMSWIHVVSGSFCHQYVISWTHVVMGACWSQYDMSWRRVIMNRVVIRMRCRHAKKTFFYMNGICGHLNLTDKIA